MRFRMADAIERVYESPGHRPSHQNPSRLLGPVQPLPGSSPDLSVVDHQRPPARLQHEQLVVFALLYLDRRGRRARDFSLRAQDPDLEVVPPGTGYAVSCRLSAVAEEADSQAAEEGAH